MAMIIHKLIGNTLNVTSPVTKIISFSSQAYANLLKGNLDGLKKRDKKTAKAAAAKAKKSKATA